MSVAIKEAILMTAEYYGRQLSETVLNMYAEDLADLDPKVVCAAYTHYRRQPANRTFPLPAQIREIACPEEYVSAEEKAREVAGRIVGAITSYGWNNGRAAAEFIGPEGWALVCRSGGWMHLCQNTGVTINPTTLQAQLRDQLESTFRHGGAAMERALGIGSGEREYTGKLESAGEIVKRLIANKDSEGEA